MFGNKPAYITKLSLVQLFSGESRRPCARCAFFLELPIRLLGRVAEKILRSACYPRAYIHTRHTNPAESSILPLHARESLNHRPG